MIKIYFCGSIRGGRELAATYERIIRMLNDSGRVLTEHVGDPEEVSVIDRDQTERYIHDRDMQWIRESDLVVAEVTIPSLGVGYEIGRAIEMKKPVLSVFNTSSGKKLSAMIAGSEGVDLYQYSDLAELEGVLKQFIASHVPRHTS
ncbi:MAG: nucleoside 2-deoxyribosyltransferase [Bacteroidota bacterium]